MPASAAAHQALPRALLRAALLLALLTIANAAFQDSSVADNAYDKDDANMCLTDAGLHAINAVTSNVTLPGDASLVVAAAKLYLWAKPVLAWLQTLDRAKAAAAANGTTATGINSSTLLPNTFIHSRASKYFWSGDLPSLGHVPSVVSLDMSGGPVTIRLPAQFSAAYVMSVLDSEFNVLASFTSHDLHQYKKASVNGSFVFAVLAPGQALADKTNTTVIRSPTPMAMAVVRTILLQRGLNTTAADPVQDAMSASGGMGPLSMRLMSPQVSAAIRATDLGPVDLLSNDTAASFNLFLATQLAAQAGFFDTRKAPFMSAATVLSSILPALGFPAGANTTQANLTSDQLAILNKGAHIGHDCIVKASQGFWTRATGAWLSFAHPDAAAVTAGADAGVLASLVPAVRLYRWSLGSEDVDGLQRTFWATKDAVGLPFNKAASYAFTSPPASPGIARFLSAYEPASGAAMLSPDSAPVFIPVAARPGGSNLTNRVRVGLLETVQRQLAAEGGAPFVPRNFLSLSPSSALQSVTTFKLVFRFVALRRSVLSSGGGRRLLQADVNAAPGTVTPIAGPSPSDLLGYVKAAANNHLIGAGYNVITGIPILGACPGPIASSWTGDPGLTRQPVFDVKPEQVSYDTQSSCSGSYTTGFQTSATSYRASSYSSVSLSAGFAGVSASSSNSWSSGMNSTYSSKNAFTTLAANCVVGHATYDSGLVSSPSHKDLLAPDFATAVANLLAQQVINDFVPPEQPTTTCLPAYFDKPISELFTAGYPDCWDCQRDRVRCTVTCTCKRVDGVVLRTGDMFLNNCLGGKLWNVDGAIQCTAGFPTVGGCTYMATSDQGGGYPAGSYLKSFNAQQSCTLTTTKTQCVLDCSRWYGSNAKLDVQKCAENFLNMPFGSNQGLDFFNDHNTLRCAGLSSSSDPASCPAFPGYAFYQKFTGGSASTKVTKYANLGLGLGQVASNCNSEPGCVGFDTFGNLWLYLTYNQFSGALGSFAPVEYTTNCGGIYISANYASTRTLNGILYKSIFNIYGTHYIKAAAFGSALNQCVTTSSTAQSQMASSSFDTANEISYTGVASASGGFKIGSGSGSSSASESASYSNTMVFSPGNLDTQKIFTHGNLVIDSTAFSQQTAAAIAAGNQVQPVTITADSLSSLITLPGPAAQILEVANQLKTAPPGGFTINNLNQLASLMDASMVFKYDDAQLGCQVGGGFPCFPV